MLGDAARTAAAAASDATSAPSTAAAADAAALQLPHALQRFVDRRARASSAPTFDARREQRIAAGRTEAVRERVEQNLQLRLAARNVVVDSDSDSDGDDVDEADQIRPGFKGSVRKRNDTLACTTCWSKYDRDYGGATNILEVALHQGNAGEQTTRPPHLAFDAAFPDATAEWKRQQCIKLWERQQEQFDAQQQQQREKQQKQQKQQQQQRQVRSASKKK